jgi:hypothetical protein
MSKFGGALMKLITRILIITTILLSAVGAMGAAPAAGADLRVAGLYKGIDTIDGSKLELRITDWKGFHQVQFTDQATSACGGGPARGKSAAVVVGTALHTYMTIKCVHTGVVVATNYDLVLVPTSQNTLMDVHGNHYTLVKGPGCRGL